MKKLVVFDFDGVLVDSLDVLYEINHKAASVVKKKLQNVAI